MLKVININSPIDLTHHDCAFVEQVFDIAEKEPGLESKNYLGFLLKNIPVLLLAKEKMPPYTYDEDENVDSEDGMEYLGFYKRINCEHFENTPTIYICPERIFLAGKEKIGYQELLAVVIIHEYAHALMDLNNENSTINYSDKFFRWVEEPFANWFVLKYFSSYGNGQIFHDIVGFISRQPANYRLGLDLYKASINSEFWGKWVMKKSSIDNQKQNNWLKFASSKYINNESINIELEKLLY